MKWGDYHTNLDKLMSNRTKSHQSSTGVARSGTVMLAVLLRRARCGHATGGPLSGASCL